MRVLVAITALLASAAAAPSGALIAPLTAPIAPLVALPAALPTLSPGDLQAAAINAKVQAEDQARVFADQAREQAEQALENQKEKVEETVDEVKEKSEDGFWAGEDKKWQALDAVNIAQAKLQGSLASIEGAVANFEGSVAANADALAKSALTGAVILPATPFVAAYPAPFVYAAPGYVAPLTKAIPTDAINQINNPEPEKLKAALPEQPKENEIAEKPKEENLLLSMPGLPLIPSNKIQIVPISYISPELAAAFAATPLAAPLVPGQVLAPAFLKY